MAKSSLYASTILFGGALALSWFTHGAGTVINDARKHINIPATLTVPLQVQAAYNGTDVYFRYRWLAPNAGIFHDMLRFTAGKWEVRGNAVAGSQPEGLHEDRVSMMLDDGAVPEFGRYGGYVAIGDRLAGFTEEADGTAIKNHAYLGRKLGLDEPTKYLPATRSNPNDWTSTVPEAQQAKLQSAGYFLDLWHWRAARSNPVGHADDQFITAGRLSDSGRGAYATNWDSDKKQPRLMFDPARAGGMKALKWDEIIGGKIDQDGNHGLREEVAAPFDPGAGWQEGDTIPRRMLRSPQASRADIAVFGKAIWADGVWDVTLKRKMNTEKPLEDKIIRDGGSYQAAFAIHRQATGGRWHYVSLPVSVGFGRHADIVATAFTGDTPDWKQPARQVTLFYPGQVSWPHLNSQKHGGADSIGKGIPVKARHSEEQLAHYGIEAEFAELIRRQWLLTLFAGLGLIVAFGWALLKSTPKLEA
ncbi:MAG: ethylbenzene dehydrogenase-related protein [Beijerinckiaceae bacterium]|nr:ethylbenzene dehydrogenase-related protein [Beijerinckiaceae bacterium]